jgi:hypothetical protein
VCEFLVSKKLYVIKINISPNHKENDVEICTFELETKSSNLIILSLNRAPTGDFGQFIKNLVDALEHLHKLKA